MKHGDRFANLEMHENYITVKLANLSSTVLDP
jgi:hypothetical protein